MTKFLDEDFITKESKKHLLFSRYLLLISGAIFIIGIIFKIQHWPLSIPMIMISSGIINGHLLGRLLKRKPSLEIILSVLLGVILLNLYILIVYFIYRTTTIYFLVLIIVFAIEIIIKKNSKFL
jgi:uncharacterized membrane protein HdeD (DUF308 family)